MERSHSSSSETFISGGQSDRVRQLTQADWKLIEQWVWIGSAIGLPRSVCHLYGLMFVISEPLTAKDCSGILKLSRSSVGQGIKLLLELGAIKPVFELGRREESYAIEPDLGVLVKKLLEGRLMPSLDQFLVELDTVRELAQREQNHRLLERLDKLSRWRSRVQPFRKWLNDQL